MKIPSFLYGRYSKVRPQCRRKVKDLQNGAAFDDLPDGDWVDTRETSGMIALEGPVRQFMTEEHFCCFGLVRTIIDDSKSAADMNAMLQQCFEAAEHEPWAFLTVLGQLATGFLDKRSEWLGRHVRAAVDMWPTLSAEGARYTFGSSSPNELWDLPMNIKFALARLGVSTKKLNAPLPPAGLWSLASEVLPDLKRQ